MLARAIRLLSPAPPAPPIEDIGEIQHRYRYWRRRILYGSLIAYALFYLVRKTSSRCAPLLVG